MPELPEVETVMRGLARAMTGQILTRVEVLRADLRRPFPPDLRQALTGARVTGFRRRGKYMLMRTDRARSALIHLGMSGRMVLGGLKQPHEHVVMETASGVRVGFIDPRRFGSLDLVAEAAEDQHELLAGLGPEPLDESFTVSALSARLSGRRTAIKAALLDQRIVAGLGNIYVSEALFRAGIAPRRLAGSIPGVRAARLVPQIKATLADAIAAGGSSLRDYVQPGGELGYFQHAWRVYDRAGHPCERCPGPPACQGIRQIVQGARSTFYCPRTQR